MDCDRYHHGAAGRRVLKSVPARGSHVGVIHKCRDRV